MKAGDRISIVEVGPRDGLQNEVGYISTSEKLKLIHLLAQAGFTRIEATAFVSARWVPQMADHDAVMRDAERWPGVSLAALVPNEKGAKAAIAAGAAELAIFASASESFARRNTNCTIDESIERFLPVIALAGQQGLGVRGYISCAVECPLEGMVEPSAVRSVASRLYELGCSEIAVADTIGRARPEQVDAMLAAVLDVISAERLACHFHDTSGQALNNVDVALKRGIHIFDSAAGGLGGCPYAPGAAGNLASGALVRHLDRLGYVHGIDMTALACAEQFATMLKNRSS